MNIPPLIQWKKDRVGNTVDYVDDQFGNDVSHSIMDDCSLDISAEWCAHVDYCEDTEHTYQNTKRWIMYLTLRR